MANLSSNTNLTIPRGAVVKFGLGGIGQAIDESGTYKLGNQEVILGPYPVAKTITVLVQSTVRYVIDTDGVIDTLVPIDAITPAIDNAAAQDAVLRAGQITTVTGAGDSFMARLHQAYLPSATATCSGGVITVPATSHGLTTGSLINATGAAQAAANVVRAPITRVDANTFSYPAPACPDGNITNGAATYQLTAWTQPSLESVFEHLNGFAGGGFTLTQNAGHSGHLMSAVLARYDTVLAPFDSSLHVHWGYFNDMNQGVSVEASCATVQEMLARKKASGSLCAVISAIPVPSGVYTWNAGGGMTDATAAAWVVRWNKAMRSYCEAQGMLFVDVYSPSAGVAPGYALPGVCKAADIHPSYKTARLAAKLLWAQISGRYTAPRVLSVENIGADPSALNIIRAAPSGIGAGGTVGTGATGTYTAWAAGSVAARSWRTNNGGLYYTAAGGTATTGNAPVHIRGTITTGDGVAWLYVGRAHGEAGVPAAWGVYGDATCSVHSSLVDRADGGKALRCVVISEENNDQLRASYTGTADVSGGNTIRSAIRVSLNTDFNSSNATPSGQNIKAVTAQFVVTVDGVTYTYYGRRGSAGAANEMQVDEISDEVFTVADALVPTGTVTLARWDVLVIFSGVGAASAELSALTAVKL